MAQCCCGGSERPSAPTPATTPRPRADRPRLAAVILSAGFSSRMNAFKPLLPLDGRTALERAVDLFQQAGIPDIAVVLGHRAEDLAPEAERLGAVPVLNPDYARGMYSSIMAGLRALPPEVDGCFLLPVDIPLVRPRTIRALADSFRDGTPVLYPVFHGRHGHPPLIARALFAEILHGDGDGGLKRVLEGHAAEAEELDVFDEAILLDMDTPAAYEHLRAHAARSPVPSPVECLEMLTRMGASAPVIRHGRAVAAVALALADGLDGALNRDLIRAGALLHDIAKGSVDHAATGARMLASLGCPDVARIVATHGDPAADANGLDEAALVFLADKLVREARLVSIEDRFAPALTRFADDPEALRAATRRLDAARRIAAAVETRLGVSLQDRLAGRDRSLLLAEPREAVAHRTASLGTTESVCPVCLRRIPAERVLEDGDVFLVKTCPEHGTTKSIVWRGAPAYRPWGRNPAPISPPSTCATGVDRGCPFDCGLCPDHRQQSCCVLVEVTQRCNLACPVCFAASGRAAADPSLDEVGSWLEMLRASGRMVNIQLSGGEPTVRDDLPDIVALAHSLGFGFVQANTNGLRIADDPAYLRRLKEAGLDCVFLQFDGVTDAVYRRIRGRDLLAVKERAIRNCAALNLGVVLVPVLVPGVNTMQIGDIIHFAIDRMPTVRTVHFQPVSHAGRFPHPPQDSDRITIPEVLRHIEWQTGGMFRTADFRPGTAENPFCSFNGEFVIRSRDDVVPSRAPASSCCCGGTDAETDPAGEAEQARRFVARRWAAPVETEKTSCCSGTRVDSLDAFLADRKHTLCLSGMAFQDAWTLDLDRLRQCYIHVVSPDRRLVPLCAYNLSNLSGDTLYQRPRP